MVESALPELTHNWSVLVRADQSRAESPRFPSADNDALTTADWSVNVTCLALGQPSPGNLELGQKKAIGVSPGSQILPHKPRSQLALCPHFL